MADDASNAYRAIRAQLSSAKSANNVSIAVLMANHAYINQSADSANGASHAGSAKPNSANSANAADHANRAQPSLTV